MLIFALVCLKTAFGGVEKKSIHLNLWNSCEKFQLLQNYKALCTSFKPYWYPHCTEMLNLMEFWIGVYSDSSHTFLWPQWFKVGDLSRESMEVVTLIILVLKVHQSYANWPKFSDPAEGVGFCTNLPRLTWIYQLAVKYWSKPTEASVNYINEATKRQKS